ncbi:MAG: S8 family serine peptidase, partial [Dehalococcoidia bacterium]|nr:S8 family serine peptidase [Dehalococcoidia bacterium]
MKLNPSVKSLGMKILTTILTLVMLVGTSSLVAVLTQQKALEAAQQARMTDQSSLPDDEFLPEIFKTDRFIVKYKENKANSFKSKLPYTILESRSLDAVKSSLETSAILPSGAVADDGGGSRSSASSRYADMEVIILSEELEPWEFEEAVLASGAYTDVLYVQADYELEIASIDAGLSTVGSFVPNQPNSSISGPAIVIAIIDTGVDPLHAAYASYLHPQTPNVYDPSNPLAFSHGTHIAGIIAGEASYYGANIQLLVLPVFSEGYAYTSDILAAIETAELFGASVVNCSFGSLSYNQALYEAMDDSSMLFVCAAGNARTDFAVTQVYPACFGLDNVISVGSVNNDKGYSYFSNYNGVDISAIGREVTSAIPGGGYGPMTGTSMAAAKVSAAAAVILADGNVLGASALRARILNSADKLTHLNNKVTNGRYLSTDNAVAGIAGSVFSNVQYEDDFDAHGYAPTPEELYTLFSSLTVVQVAAGYDHTLVLMSDGSVWAWGTNNWGQCGIGTASSSEMLVQVIGLSNVIAVAAGRYHSLAVKSDGTVWAWGNNGYGKLGDGTTTNRYTAVQVSGLTGVTAIAAGYYHSIALKSGGTVWAWGWNDYGQLGDGTSVNRSTAVQVSGLTGITAIAGGYAHSLALKSNNTVWSWGQNTYGQLGDGTTTQSPTAVQVSGLTGVTAIDGGGTHSVALLSSGTVWAWGNNNFGQLGHEALSSRKTPIQVVGLTGVAAIAGGYDHSLALKSDGTVWTWGRNNLGQLGNGTLTNSATPVQVIGLTGVTAIAAGAAQSLALKSDGTVWAWGNNCVGQLGDGSTTNRTTPVQVIGLTGITAIAAGSLHSLAIKSNGTVWAWGYNYAGQLGDGTLTNRSSPVQVSGLTGVTAIDGGDLHSIALKSNGTVSAWGYNYFGQLGDGTTTDRKTPVQVSGLTGATAIAAGYYHSIAIKSGGTVWAWGYNNGGRLGDGTTIDRKTPVQVSGLTGVTAISAGDYHSMARKSDGTVWTCGWNGNGQYGNGTTTESSTPVVSQLTGTAIAAGYYHSMVLKPDNTVWACGYNEYGQVGNGGISQSNIPVQSFLVFNQVIPSQLIFNQFLYTLAIPESGSPAATIGVSATVFDQYGTPVSNPSVAYGLDSIYTGVSINSATGLITVSSTASPGSIGLTATCSGLTAYAVLDLLVDSTGEDFLLNVTAGEFYTVSAWAYNIDDFDGLIFTLTYDPLMLEIDDLSALTWLKELTIGEIPGTNVTIISFSPGEIVFSVDEAIPYIMTWSGITNAFRFKALGTGSTTISLSQEMSNRGGSSSGGAGSIHSSTALKSLREDQKAYELLVRMSEYNDFTKQEKEYICQYLGIIAPLTEDGLSYIANRQPSAPSEVILFRLIENNVLLSQVSAGDWDKISKFFGNLSDEQRKELSAKGTTVGEAIQINLTMRYSMFSLDEAERIVQMYPDAQERNDLVFNLYLYTYGSTNVSSARQYAKDMILRGVTMSTVIQTLNLTVDIQRIVIENGIGDPSSSPPRSGADINEGYDPTAPFSVGNGSGDSIDLISGNLSYIYDVLSLPGIAGFDLDLSLIYNSSDAALYHEFARQNSSFQLFYVPYQLVYSMNNFPYDVNSGYKIFLDLSAAITFAYGYTLLETQ